MASNVITVGRNSQYTTIQQGIDAAEASGIHDIVIDAGSYTETDTLSGAAADGLTITAAPGGGVTLYGSFIVDGASGVTISGLTFQGDGTNVAVSAAGIRPLSEVERRAVALGNYRTVAASTEPWLPWSDIVRDTFDGYGLTLDTASRDEPVVLTDSAENLLPLHQLMGEWIARARRAHSPAAPTGVRVEVAARPFGAPPGEYAEAPAEDPAVAAQRRR